MDEITADTVVEAARQAAGQNGGPLSRADFERLTGISEYHIYGIWLETNHPNSPLLEEIQVQSRHEIPPPPSIEVMASPGVTTSTTQWTKIKGPEFGPPSDFRGLRHAPINEQGVVFLFRMVAYEHRSA